VVPDENLSSRPRLRFVPDSNLLEHISWLGEQMRLLGLAQPEDNTHVRKWVGRKRRKGDFHDAFIGGTLHLSGLYSEEEARSFAQSLGVTPKRIDWSA
jgi:hypothetical protein